LAAQGLALCVALLWLVHPLQTASVTYIVQRLEALMGLFYLLALYCLLRGATAGEGGGWRVDGSSASALHPPPSTLHRFGWYGGAILCFFLGMRTKEVMVTAPVVLLLYDRLFLSRSWGQLWQRRGGLYAVLFVLAIWLTWPILQLALAHGSPGKPAAHPTPAEISLEAPSAGFGHQTITPLAYARSQPEVIVHYLRVAFWPDGLCLDYAWPITPTWGAAAPSIVCIALLGLATLWALWRRPWLGFLGAWFFLILAPTSSIMPIDDLAFDHRMYLPLAAVIALGVFAGYALLGTLARRRPHGQPENREQRIENREQRTEDRGQRTEDREKQEGRSQSFSLSSVLCPLSSGSVGAGLVGVLALALGLATVLRNAVYRDPVAIWSDVVAKRPDNVRGWGSLADAQFLLGQQRQDKQLIDQAVLGYRKAVGIPPDSERSHNPLRAYPVYYNSLGVALLKRGETDQALACYARAIELAPAYSSARNNLGVALYKKTIKARFGPVLEEVAQSLRLAGAVLGGVVFVPEPPFEEAVQSLRQAVKLEKDSVRQSLFRFNLATILNAQGKEDDARAEYRQALQKAPGWPEVARQSAWQLATSRRSFPGDGPEAVFLARQACQAYQAAGKEKDLSWRRLAGVYKASPGAIIRNITWNTLAAVYWHTLAAAYAADQDYDQAVRSARKALEWVSASPEKALREQIEKGLSLYQHKRPFRGN
jgi:tetratricopeptide (TPR) repeat protein